MYDLDYFIKKFEAIPEKKWFVGSYSNADHTKFCALGHCIGYADEGHCLHTLFNKNGLSVSLINDGKEMITKYGIDNKTPKQRILAALYDIRDKELSEANVNAAKEIIEVESNEVVTI